MTSPIQALCDIASRTALETVGISRCEAMGHAEFSRLCDCIRAAVKARIEAALDDAADTLEAIGEQWACQELETDMRNAGIEAARLWEAK